MKMKNREIFQRDPAITKLLNDGVAAVTESATKKEIETLRYELGHFVCEDRLFKELYNYQCDRCCSVKITFNNQFLANFIDF